jgi:hypothetical protein
MQIGRVVVLLLAGLVAACGAPAPTPDVRGAARTLGVNGFLWRAALETLSFMPLLSADPFGGVINSDWYAAPARPDERKKVTVYISDRQLRADGVRVQVFQQQRRGAEWQPPQPAAETARSLENAILARARELRLAALEIR